MRKPTNYILFLYTRQSIEKHNTNKQELDFIECWIRCNATQKHKPLNDEKVFKLHNLFVVKTIMVSAVFFKTK